MRRPSKEALAISGAVCDFLGSYAPSHLTASDNTLRSYRTAIGLYLAFLEGEKGVAPETLSASAFSRGNVEEWLRWLSGDRGCGPETCNVRLGSLRAFLTYLGSRRPEWLHLPQEAAGIPLMKAGRKKVDGMSRDAVAAILRAPDPATRSGRRDLTLMVVLYATAARIDEVLSLKVGQLDLECPRPHATITGKGGKMRTLYLPAKAADHVKAYLSAFHGAKPDPDAYLFYSRNAGPRGKLTQPAVAKMLRKHAAAASEECADVPLGLHAHQFRHAKASHWLEDGMNVVQISFLLGHANVQTTMRYLDITLDEERAALATLEDESARSVAPKWRNDDGSLKSFCGLE